MTESRAISNDRSKRLVAMSRLVTGALGLFACGEIPPPDEGLDDVVIDAPWMFARKQATPQDGPPDAPRPRTDDSFFKTARLDAEGIEAKRAEVVDYLWGATGLPTRLPTTIRTLRESPIHDLENLGRAEVMHVTMDTEMESWVYFFAPVVSNGRAVILHHGHDCLFNDGFGIKQAARALLGEGYAVLVAHMPRGRPGNVELGLEADCTLDHPKVLTTEVETGHALKFFVEPVVVAINELARRGYSDVAMVGLSGGGWTTTLAAAIDTRIKTSIPVAGTIPSYLRMEPYPHDIEQYFAEFYGAYDDPRSGIAGYMDLYLLGGAGAGRAQVQILNRKDDCCFGQRHHDAVGIGAGFDEATREYAVRLRSVLAAPDAGSFRLIIDEAAPSHLISDSAIQFYILPTLASQPVPTTIRNPWGGACIDVPPGGTDPQVFRCHGRENQQFLFLRDGTIRSNSGLCLTVGGAGDPSAGDPVTVRSCDLGSSQLFDVFSDGSIRTRVGGLCAVIAFMSRVPQTGDHIEVQTCEGAITERFQINI